VKTLMLAAGGSKAYADAGFFFPKNLTEIAGRPLIEHAIVGLGEAAVTTGWWWPSPPRRTCATTPPGSSASSNRPPRW
jgi:hypothetical protein